MRSAQPFVTGALSAGVSSGQRKPGGGTLPNRELSPTTGNQPGIGPRRHKRSAAAGRQPETEITMPEENAVAEAAAEPAEEVTEIAATETVEGAEAEATESTEA